jgi:hypothetical protein
MITGLYRWFHHVKARILLPVLEILLIIQTGIIGISALTRLNLYQEAYGFTVLRLYTEWFIYFMFVVFVWFTISIIMKRSYREYLSTSMIIGSVALVAVTCQNVDYMIAKKNVDRFLKEQKDLDLYYITNELSIDVAPVIKSLYGLNDEQLKRINSSPFHGEGYEYQNLLNNFEWWVKTDFAMEDSFFEYNAGVQKAYRLFAKLK